MDHLHWLEGIYILDRELIPFVFSALLLIAATSYSIFRRRERGRIGDTLATIKISLQTIFQDSGEPVKEQNISISGVEDLRKLVFEHSPRGEAAEQKIESLESNFRSLARRIGRLDTCSRKFHGLLFFGTLTVALSALHFVGQYNGNYELELASSLMIFLTMISIWYALEFFFVLKR